MKRRILITAILLLALTLTACSEPRPYTYTWAIIVLDGETIAEGHMDAYIGYPNGDVRVEIDGKGYYTGSENVILMEDPPTTHDQPKTTEAHA